MSDGIWNGGPAQEKLRQGKLSRERNLIVNCGTRLNVAWQPQDASGLASLDPNSINPGTVNTATNSNRGNEGGPHFIMSGETPDVSHTYGFEFCLYNQDITAPALPGTGGYTVTVWALMSISENPISLVTPIWASLLTQTGVNARELWHSFDINARAIRFQFGNLALDPTANSRSIGILFNEL